MSDEIREFLREAAGPRDAPPFEIESLVRRSRRRRAGRAIAVVAVLAGIAFVAVGVFDVIRPAPVAPVVGPAPGPTDPTPPRAVGPGEETLRFTFTGADGTDGCRYDGPSRVVAGQHPIELVDTSGEQEGTVGIEPLAEGYDFDDFVASLGDVDQQATVDREAVDPPYRLDRRTTYDWRPEPSTSFGLEGLRIVQGPDIDLDEVSLPPGIHAMYCAVPVVTQERYDLWPVGQLTVVEAP